MGRRYTEATIILHKIANSPICAGDEPFHSEDTNRFGPVPQGLVDSKLSFIIWPVDRIGPISKPVLPDLKAKRGPAWRRNMNEVERQQRREARVTVASDLQE